MLDLMDYTTISPFLFYLPLLFPLYLISKHFHRKFKNYPPAPFLTLPVVGHLYLFKKPLHKTLTNISKRYGPVVLLQFGSRKVLSVSSPSAVEECLSRNDVIFANRPRLLAGKHIGYNYTSLASASYGDHWRNLRKIISTEILSNNRLQTLHETRANEVKSMIRKLDSSSKAGSPVEMKTLFSELMLNLLMRMIAGKRYYGDDKEVDVKEAARIREIVREVVLLGGATNAGDYVPSLSRVSVKLEESLRQLQLKRDDYLQDLIRECREKKVNGGVDGGGEAAGKKKSFVGVLLTRQAEEPEYYKDEIIRGLIGVILAAGIDTSSATMEWTLSLLLNHQQILKKAQEEIDDKVGYERLVEESDMVDLPYLNCIIKEAMRMHPAAPLAIPHESSKECTVAGYRIPKGTMLLLNLYSIQRDPKYWDEPERFKPERFKDLVANTTPKEQGYKWMPFGLGRRGCPGEALAWRMVGMSLASIIQCFDWERLGSELIDMSEEIGVTMPKATPLVAKCKTRPFVTNLLSTYTT
ncbi:unnamed protein product [Cuscuta epithymum]|uniref:Uncharacterized protein n=1 Tax=Cuscuta epithymum TaxID=186058 RepID=A0AAV0DIV0_9ASTE|nr:unnamed protein product [Cuscuta epithymum]